MSTVYRFVSAMEQGFTRAHPDTPSSEGLLKAMAETNNGTDSGRSFEPTIISVATPVHVSYADRLGAAYESVARQVWPASHQKIIWNLQVDGPSDSSGAQTIRDLVKRFNNEGVLDIRLAENGRQVGIAGTRNAALMRAHFDGLVVLLDSDDALEPDALIRFERVFERNAAIGWAIAGKDAIDGTEESPHPTEDMRVLRGGLFDSALSGLSDADSARVFGRSYEFHGYDHEHILCAPAFVLSHTGGSAPLAREEDFALLFRLSGYREGVVMKGRAGQYFRWEGQTTAVEKVMDGDAFSLRQLAKIGRLQMDAADFNTLKRTNNRSSADTSKQHHRGNGPGIS